MFPLNVIQQVQINTYCQENMKKSKSFQSCFNHLNGREPFLSTLQNVGVKFLQGVEKFQQGEVLFVQAKYKFLHAAKML